MLHPEKNGCHNGHLSTTVTFLCPQVGRCGEVRLYKYDGVIDVHMQGKSAIAAKEKLEKTRAENSERLSKQNKQRDEQFAKLLQETETRHSKFICHLS